MSVKKLKSGKWQADIRPDGKTRKRKSFRTKAEALRWINTISAKAISEKEWNTSQKDNRRLTDYIDLWWSLHGKNLKNKKSYDYLMNLSNSLANPIAQELTKKQFIEYRARRIEEGISNTTVNFELTMLKSVYNFLVEIEETYSNPIGKIKPLKQKKFSPTYLSQEQIKKVVDTAKEKKGDTWLCVLLGFSTGGRWSEISGIALKNIKEDHVVFRETKAGKSRRVPISNELYKTIHEKCQSDVLRGTEHMFKQIITKAEITLPRGQLTHVMRHTFASHFIMNGGNILALKELLGHSTINMTMVYAHLSPEAMNSAIKLNPINYGHIMDA